MASVVGDGQTVRRHRSQTQLTKVQGQLVATRQGGLPQFTIGDLLKTSSTTFKKIACRCRREVMTSNYRELAVKIARGIVLGQIAKNRNFTYFTKILRSLLGPDSAHAKCLLMLTDFIIVRCRWLMAKDNSH